ncbi:MAG: hypothetical protein LBF97_02770, partial [Elusimicrobiota bacterium]|nr:hypothetical protein [Elusimicrobiota bacterium]
DITKIKIRRLSKSGRVRELTLFWENGSLIIKGRELREMFYKNIKSTKFQISDKKDGVFFKGFGYGHGVGMCQYGAKVMGEKNIKYKQIIKFYFNGVEIKEWQTIQNLE